MRAEQNRPVDIEVIIHHINHPTEELSQHPTIEYYGADGRPVSTYASSLSHEQILQHCLGALCSCDAQPLIITVGTYRDAAGRCSESIKEKNQKLKTLLDDEHFLKLYNGESLENVIFAVNCKVPQDDDRHVARLLREQIINVCPQAIKMPIAWFGLEVHLQRTSHNGNLSLVECQASAKTFHIERDEFSAALHYLVHHNVLLHYPEVLPQTVFCDPQVVLTKVTEYHHKLLYNPDMVVTGLLRMFPKHYQEGLFTQHDLLHLLLSVGAIAVIKDGVYLMPALLCHLDSVQASKYVEQATIFLGRFALIETSHCGNCITFELDYWTEIVTLVDMFSYIVVHVDKMSHEWECSILNCQNGDLSEGQLMWLAKTADATNQDHSTAGEDQFNLEVGNINTNFSAVVQCSYHYPFRSSGIGVVSKKNGNLLALHERLDTDMIKLPTFVAQLWYCAHTSKLLGYHHHPIDLVESDLLCLAFGNPKSDLLCLLTFCHSVTPRGLGSDPLCLAFGNPKRPIQNPDSHSCGWITRSGDVIHPQLWESGSGYETTSTTSPVTPLHP
eukprot:Em0024g148a